MCIEEEFLPFSMYLSGKQGNQGARHSSRRPVPYPSTWCKEEISVFKRALFFFGAISPESLQVLLAETNSIRVFDVFVSN